MALKLISNLIFTFSFYKLVIAITPCDVKQIPLKLKPEDIFLVEKPAVNRPLLEETVSTTVNLSLSINDINIIDIKTLDVEIDLSMTQKWYDHRLGPNYKTRKLAVLGGIWQPKITFVVGNNKCSNLRSGMENDQTQFFRGTSNGSVFYSERFLVKPKCTKDLTKYPFDEQICFIKIGSYRFTYEEVSLQWDFEMPIELRVDKELGEFRLEKWKTYNEMDNRSSGKFSVLVLEIHLSRYSRREILQSFLPSVIFVKIAYAVFWIKLTEIRTRIFTCQFSFFGILFLFTSSINCDVVGNSTDFKALDIWFLICIIFVLLPLAESFLIHHFHPLKKNPEDETEIEAKYEMKFSKKFAIRIDKILRLLHPIGYMLSSTILFIAKFKGQVNDE